MKLVIDTNLWISYFLGKKVKEQLGPILFNPQFDILYCSLLKNEVKTVVSRSKFKKYITPARLHEIFMYIEARVTEIQPDLSVKLSRDIKDNFLLDLSRDGMADYLITGDDYLLTLKKYGKTQIVTLTQFLKIIVAK